MFTNRFTKSVARTTVAAAVLGVTAVIAAGTANAGAVDDTFLAALDEHGIVPPSAEVAIGHAQGICRLLDKGYEPEVIVAAVAKVTSLSTQTANRFALDAAKAYCPQYVKTT